MTTDIETIENIPDGKPVKFFLTLKEGSERYRTQCVYQKSAPPKFSLLFKPGVLPVDDIALDQPSIINLDMGGEATSLDVKILEITNSQTLQMVVKKAITYEQMRDYFRVDTTTDIISKSFHPEIPGNKNKSWSIKGKTVDISGSGILALFPERPSTDRQLLLQITIPPGEQETITILAHRIRTKKLENGSYEVAYHFDDISTEDRDKIIGCCLDIQRQLLRLKVRVKNLL